MCCKNEHEDFHILLDYCNLKYKQKEINPYVFPKIKYFFRDCQTFKGKK